MVERNTVSRITQTLRNAGLPWLLPNLRQDFVVWQALNDPSFIDRVLGPKPDGAAFRPRDFSPSQLALAALDPAGLPQVDNQHPPDSIYNQAVSVALLNGNGQAHQAAAVQQLASAGLAALSWLNQYASCDAWSGLLTAIRENPHQDWKTTIACLFGLLDQPVGLLRSLVQSRSAALGPALAVHALLCNPLSVNEQVALLVDMCHQADGELLPAGDRLRVVGTLSEQSPQVARQFALKWVEIQTANEHLCGETPTDPAGQMELLLENIFQVAIGQINGEAEGLAGRLEDGMAISHDLYASLLHQSLSLKAKTATRKSPRDSSADLVGKAVRLNELSTPGAACPRRQAELALTLAERGELEKASQLLPASKEPLPGQAELLYATARLAWLMDDPSRACAAALKAAELVEAHPEGARVWGEGFSLTALGRLLLDLHRPDEAGRVFEHALQICPNDESLLKLQADSCQAGGADQKAASLFSTLVSLHPGSVAYHRALAGSLERMGDWEAGLEERVQILQAGGQENTPAAHEDQYACACSAIRAKRPEIAMQVCSAILSHNQEDSQALVYSGQAYLLMGEAEKGLECLERSTQIAPTRGETWLALAEAQKSLERRELVLDTLHHAVQAVPGCAEIHYALGDWYVQAGEPDLALPELQLAVELSPCHPQALVGYGRVLGLLGHEAESREMLGRAYDLEPGFPGLAGDYAKVLLDLGELETAVAPLETLIQSKPQAGIQPYLDYARCILRLNQRGVTIHPPMKALVALNQVLQAEPSHAEAKALTAEALTANGEFELAFQAYREALDTSLTEDKAWFERLSFGFGRAASAIGKQDIAIAALQEAGQVNPANPAIFAALSDAYISADLPEDAMRAARHVLAIDGEDADKLAWFADQAGKLIHTDKAEIFNPGLNLSRAIIDEALSALAKAIQLSPRRSDLLVQLGMFQAEIGEQTEAQRTFAGLAGLDFAAQADLLSAARYLSTAGDHAAAIACLEQCVSMDQAEQQDHALAIYTSLAQEYVQNHDHPSAIHTLDKAIETFPGNCGLISRKAQILLGLGQPQDALQVIEESLTPGKGVQPAVDLMLLASQISWSMGDFPSTVKFARMAAAPSGEPARLTATLRTVMAEIQRALLQPEKAWLVLQEAPLGDRSAYANEQDFLDAIFLHTELALDTGERISPDIQEVKLEPDHASYSRLMAINARLLNKAGNYKQAQQLYQLALNKMNAEPAEASTSSWTTPHQTSLCLGSLLGAAQDLGLWDQARMIGERIAELAAGEPISMLNLARSLVLEAEFSRLCDTFEVSRHKPEPGRQEAEAYGLCTRHLDQARELLEQYLGEANYPDGEISDGELCRWQARAEIAFGQPREQEPGPAVILSSRGSPQDCVAVMDYLRRDAGKDLESEALSQVVKLARVYPRNPAVILQVALALQEANPQQAMKSLQSVLEHNPFARNPSIAFCNLLLAKLGSSLGDYPAAQQAIEQAIGYWQDEPAWHNLASRIYQQAGDKEHAIEHLSEAASLDPNNIAYFTELGRLLLENAAEDVHRLADGQASFEHALRLDSQNLAARVGLANTHYRLGDLQQADAYARQALAQAPDQPALYQLLCQVAIEKNDFQGAHEYASQAVQLNPTDIPSTVMLARSLSAMGRHEEALARLNAVIPLVVEAKALHLERVSIVRKLNGPQIALQELKSLASNYPQDFVILNSLAKAYLEVGDVENAVTAAEQALNMQVDQASRNEQASLHLLVGQVLRQGGRLDPAIQHLSDAIQLAPNRLEPYLELGLARKEQREYQQALQIFERATTIAPDDPRALFQAGLALKESKDYKSSEMMLRRAVSLAPNDLNIRRQLAAVVALNLIHNPHSAGRR